MITEQSIPCPECKTKIPFNTKQLLMGVQFVCPVCQTAIGLSTESEAHVKDTFEKFESIKRKLPKRNNA